MKNGTKDRENSLLASRIVIDLFGPLIDISILPAFRNIPNARYLTEAELASALNKRWYHKFFPWKKRKVLSTVLAGLRNWHKHAGLVDHEVLKQLIAATEHGTQVIIVSTVSDEGVFIEAKTAIEQATTSDTRSGHDCFLFMRALSGGSSWNEILCTLQDKDDRFTWIIHDRTQAEIGVSASVDVWAPLDDNLEELQDRISEALVREERRAPIPWIASADELTLQRYEAVGKFLVFNTDLRRELNLKIEKIQLLAGAGARVVTILLSGDAGSGKTFFVEQYKDANHPGEEIAFASLAGAINLEAAVKAHITDIVAAKAPIAFLDEVDTPVNNAYAFRFLMGPMTGQLTDDTGMKTDIDLHAFVWFQAGSSGRTRNEFENALYPHDKKVHDWLSRMDEVFELPGVSAPFEAMLQGVAHMVHKLPKLREIEKSVLLFFAVTKWQDARAVGRIPELVSLKDNNIAQVSAAHVETVLTDDLLVQSLKSAREQAGMQDYVRLV